MNRRTVLLNFFILFLVFSFLELISGYLLTSKKIYRSSLLYAITSLSNKFSSPIASERLSRVLFHRSSGKHNTYPAYFFDPQVHKVGTTTWFSHPPNSLIVYCNEGSGLLEFKTNSFGFRSISNQDLTKPIDILMVGDSYAEGACVNSPFDLASILSSRHNVLNLGRGGSGPLFQLGLLQEILSHSTSSDISFQKDFHVIWLIFTGNDLSNLVEERSSLLSNYLLLDNFSTNYFRHISSDKLHLEFNNFHQSVISKSSLNSNIGNHGYGETLFPGSFAESNSLTDFALIVRKFNDKVLSYGGKLSIVVLENHPDYDVDIMANTQSLIRNECANANISCLYIDLQSKVKSRNHLDEAGYSRLANQISSFVFPGNR